MARTNETVTIIENKMVGPGYVRLVVDAQKMARNSRPGQFFMLRVPGVFLRRPFSVYDADKGRLSFLYKIVGAGTEYLSLMKPGSSLGILGPLGTRYEFDAVSPGTIPVIVAGGTGIASLHFLAQRISQSGKLFYGARTKKDLLCLKEFRARKWQLHLATDDGSCGHKGLVTDMFKKFLAEQSSASSPLAVFACGPKLMLDAVTVAAAAHGIVSQISLESMMACGMGNCQGCAVKIGNEYKMVCKDGPVFNV
ncbi:MAG: dihydroorotate dehydrogenase electron transfer subunit [Elusimicrobia bacterium]|nr:dihydroorotate dehydrogenase electron transfer subunit [Elusimicrobiota bacterium]